MTRFAVRRFFVRSVNASSRVSIREGRKEGVDLNFPQLIEKKLSIDFVFFVVGVRIKTIMIVDSEIYLRKKVKTLLKKEDVEVVTASK